MKVDIDKIQFESVADLVEFILALEEYKKITNCSFEIDKNHLDKLYDILICSLLIRIGRRLML